jgi:ABC-type multidrug transport system fused ATPase/permease subunit
MLPIFSSIIIFAVYVAMYGQEQLSTAKAYTVLSIFNLIANPMRLVVMSLINYMNAKASLERVEHFFGYDERSMEGINTDNENL